MLVLAENGYCVVYTLAVAVLLAFSHLPAKIKIGPCVCIYRVYSLSNCWPYSVYHQVYPPSTSIPLRFPFYCLSRQQAELSWDLPSALYVCQKMTRIGRVRWRKAPKWWLVVGDLSAFPMATLLKAPTTSKPSICR